MGATLASWLLLGPIAECEAFILAPASSSAAASLSPREEIEKQKAKERYMKMHLAGKTEQAKADLARLAIIRKQREEAARKKEEERKGECRHCSAGEGPVFSSGSLGPTAVAEHAYFQASPGPELSSTVKFEAGLSGVRESFLGSAVSPLVVFVGGSTLEPLLDCPRHC